MRNIKKSKNSPASALSLYDKEYEKALMGLKPACRVKFSGLSLVVKYSEEFPDIILTCDESGLLYLINTIDINKYPRQPGTGIREIEFLKCIPAHNGPIFDADWHDCSRKIITASGDLSCALWDVEKMVKICQGAIHTNSVRAIKSCPYNSNLFASGGKDGTLVVWDIRMNTKGNFTNKLISNVIDCNEAEIHSYTGINFYNDEATLLTTQANDNNITIWDLRKTKNVSEIKTGPGSTAKKSIGVKQKKNKNCIAGSINPFTSLENRLGTIFSDLTNIQVKCEENNRPYLDYLNQKLKKLMENADFKNYVHHKEKSIKGLTSMCLSNDQKKLLVNSIDHTIYLYEMDLVDVNEPRTFTGHKSNYYVRSVMSPCHNYIVSGSKDKNLYIWKADGKPNEPLLCLNDSHFGEINGVDWGINNTNFISSVSDDKTMIIWDFCPD